MHYPEHLAIIPDGNRTRASLHKQDTIQGHLAGADNSKKLIQYIFTQTPINVLTLRGLSTENSIKRGVTELQYLTNIFINQTQDSELDDFLIKHQINFRRLGSVEGIDKTLIDALRNKTKHHTYNTHKTLCIAINYGGRNEIVRAIQKIHSKEPHKPVTEKLINEHLDTAGLPNVDLIIRTKARQAQRLSGYLIRQAAYAELYFADMHYPDFDINECNKALSWYNEIVSYRNFGK